MAAGDVVNNKNISKPLGLQKRQLEKSKRDRDKKGETFRSSLTESWTALNEIENLKNIYKFVRWEF